MINKHEEFLSRLLAIRDDLDMLIRYGVEIFTPPQPPPPPPTGLQASITGDLSILLSWDPVPGALFFKVWVDNADGSTSLVDPFVNSESVTLTALQHGIIPGTYSLRVSTVGEVGESHKSSPVIASPGSPDVPEPTNLVAVAGNAVVDLSWTSIPSSSFYRVKRSTTMGGPYTTIADNYTFNTYQDTTVTNSVIYFYVVTNVEGAAESTNSNEVSARPEASPGAPAQVTGLSVTAGNQQNSLTWNTVANAQFYRVKRSTVTGGPYSQISTSSDGIHVDAGLTNGVTQYYVISAVDSDGDEGPNSAEQSGTPLGNPTQTSELQIIVHVNSGGTPQLHDLHPRLFRSDRNDPVLPFGITYQNFLGLNTSTDDPVESTIKNAIINGYGANYNGIVCTDIETWNPWITTVQSGETLSHMQKLQLAMQWVKEAVPSALTGNYPYPLTLPGALSAASKPPGDPLYDGWHAKNVAMQPVTNTVEAFFPSFYVRTENQSAWQGFVRGYMEEQWNRIPNGRKDTWAFLSRRYESGITNPPGLGAEIPYDYFLFTLNELNSQYHKDRGLKGLVIWMTGTWDVQSTRVWWRALRDFLGIP